MAEGLLKKLRGEQIYVDSVGVREGVTDGMAIATMAECGIDLTDHVPKKLDDLTDTLFDLIITLTPEAHHRALEVTRTSAAEVEYWPMPDPSAVEGNRDIRLDAYRALRERLEKLISERFSDE